MQAGYNQKNDYKQIYYFLRNNPANIHKEYIGILYINILLNEQHGNIIYKAE